MAEKKAIVVLGEQLALAAGGEALDKFSRKAAILTRADAAGLEAEIIALGGVKAGAAELAQALEQHSLVYCAGGADVLAAAMEAANRRTLIVAATAEGVAFYGLAVNGKAGSVERPVTAADIALTVATIVDLPITAECTAAVIYQVLKDPNLKLNELIKLQEALARMESVIERNNREPWDKHDCA